MSPSPSSRRPAPKGKVKTGICENHNYLNPKTDQTGDCPKCASGEKIKVEVTRLSDFRCPVCGEKLTPVKEPVSKWIWIGSGIAAVAAIAIAAVCLLLPSEEKKDLDPVQKPAGQVQNSIGKIDSDSVVEPVIEEPLGEGETEKEGAKTAATPKEEPKASPSAPAQKTVLGGTAVLVNNGGNITIKFKRSYQLDMGEMDGSTLPVYSGDEIYMANVRNGILYGGQLKRSSGEEISIQGIRVKL